jgi:hypothetical protein
MREIICALLGMLITWLAIFFIVSVADFDIKLWELVVAASVGGIFACLLVLLGESVIEDIVKIVILLILGGVLWATTPRLGYIFISALLSGVTGAVINQINQYAANKRMRSDPAKLGR